MPGRIPPTSQLDWLISTTAMIVLFWSRATRDLLRSFGWGIAALHRLHAATKLPPPRRPPHRIYQFRESRHRCPHLDFSVEAAELVDLVGDWALTFAAAAYDLVRLPKLIGDCKVNQAARLS